MAVIVGERETDESYGDTYLNYTQHEMFDSGRMKGDSQFLNQQQFEWVFEYHDWNEKDYETCFRRPKDIDEAIKWAKKRISAKSRLIPLLQEMKTNDKLWIKISY